MAGPSDLMWQPSDHVRFGSLEFLVGPRSKARDVIPRLFLVADRDVTVKLAEQYPLQPRAMGARAPVASPTAPATTGPACADHL